MPWAVHLPCAALVVLCLGHSLHAAADMQPIGDEGLGEIDASRHFFSAPEHSNSSIDMSKPGSAELMLAIRLLQAGKADGFRKRLQAAANQNNDYAQYILSGLLFKESVEKNSQTALTLLHKSAEQDNPLAQLALATMYYHGNIFPQDFAESSKWACRAAGREIAEAEMLYAMHHYYGAGMKTDLAKALFWVEKASAHGLHNAKAKVILWQKFASAMPEFHPYSEEPQRTTCP